MVTPNEVDTSSESASSPEAPESLPATGDEPLIPANFVEGIGVVEPGAATETAATTGDETPSDETATDDTQETAESTEETPAAETTETPDPTETETAPAEGEESTPRVRTDEEWNNRERSYRQRDSERDTEVQTLRDEVAQIRNQSQDAILNAQANGYINALTQRYQDDGMDERQASDRATAEVTAGVADWKTQQENLSLKAQIQQEKDYSSRTATNASVAELMREYGVPDGQRELLAGYTDARLAVRTAKALGEAESERQTQIKAKQAEVPSGGPENSFDKGSGGSTTQSGEDWLLNVYNPGFADTPADHARARQVQAELGWV